MLQRSPTTFPVAPTSLKCVSRPHHSAWLIQLEWCSVRPTWNSSLNSTFGRSQHCHWLDSFHMCSRILPYQLLDIRIHVGICFLQLLSLPQQDSWRSFTPTAAEKWFIQNKSLRRWESLLKWADSSSDKRQEMQCSSELIYNDSAGWPNKISDDKSQPKKHCMQRWFEIVRNVLLGSGEYTWRIEEDND